MKVICLSTNVEWHFSHNDPFMALAYALAEKTNRMTLFALQPSKLVEEVKLNARSGKWGFHLGSLSCPKISLI